MLGRKLPARWERASFSSLSRCGKRIPVCLLNTGRAPFCEAERLGFFPLAVKLYSHRITTCLRFLKPFVQMSNSYCAGSKFRPWLSRPWNPFNPAPGSEAPRTHTKEGIKKNTHTHTQKLQFGHQLFRAHHCAKLFECNISFNPHNKPCLLAIMITLTTSILQMK